MRETATQDVPATAECSILLCTLGASWAVIPEVLCWLAPDIVDLYANHPERRALDDMRAVHGLPRPTELWVATTDGSTASRSVSELIGWWRALHEPLPLRIWQAANTNELGSRQECGRMRELTLRMALLADACARPPGRLVMSLAGGRKTMSADLQDAAATFGAAAWIHVVGPEPMPPELRSARTDTFVAPLPEAIARAISPVIVGSGTRSELVDLERDGMRIDAVSFALSLPSSGTPLQWSVRSDAPLLDEALAARQRDSRQLMGNFLERLESSDPYDNWHSLYRLSPALIERLRGTVLDESARPALDRLPKADLHRHLGGCLDVAAQRRVAEAIWNATSAADRDVAWSIAGPLVRANSPWPVDWPRRLEGAGRAAAAAALLLNASPERLQWELYEATAPRVALCKSSPLGFAAYERPGELSGSALLVHPAAITPYANAVVEQARQEGLEYLEIRGSPHKYRPLAPEAFLAEFRAALRAAGARTDAADARSQGPRIGFIWIIDRRQPLLMEGVVWSAVRARERLPGFLLGLDVAGDEGTQAPEQLARHFAPAFAACMPITIHAGEGEPAENIWQAAYHLHADRVGHGLSLVGHPELAQRFRNRGVLLELCPSSNREVVGFRDPAFPASEGRPEYPLQKFIKQGLPLTLCTDNPGISRTSLAGEFVAASRMSPAGLSWWDALAISRQAFLYAFTDAAERDDVRRRAEQAVYKFFTDGSLGTSIPGTPI
jgi:adenosine deaminase